MHSFKGRVILDQHGLSYVLFSADVIITSGHVNPLIFHENAAWPQPVVLRHTYMFYFSMM